MKSPQAPAIRAVLILKSDRLYAEILRQHAARTFPAAEVTVVDSVEAATFVISTVPVQLLITGAGTLLEGDVLDLLAHCRETTARTLRMLVVTARRDSRLLDALRTLEVDGVFDSGTDSPDQLGSALAALAQGARYWSLSISQHMQRTGEVGSFIRFLTGFEQLVLSVIGDGSDDSSAAGELGVSPATISTVRRDLHRKLGVQHRGELVRIAAQNGFVRFTPAGVVRPGFAMLFAAYQARRLRRHPATSRVSAAVVAPAA